MIEAKGFLRRFLETQMDGLTGHIEECGYPFNIVEWGKEEYNTTNGTPNWWVYEQTGYWLDGYTRCAIALNDKEKLKRSESIIYNVINNPDADGFLGPRNLKNENAAWWPHVVFFRSVIALYEYNHDIKLMEALKNHYLNTNHCYFYFRDVLNIEIILYVYSVFNDDRLLSLALNIYKGYNEADFKFNQINDKKILSKKKYEIHGVTYNEYSKLGALIYKYTHDKYFLDISIQSYKNLVKFYMLPGCCNCSNEQTHSSYYYETYETCDISDFSYSNEQILKIAKKSIYGDRVEQCVFNAGVGSVLENFRGLQYFSCANQLILDHYSNHDQFNRGRKWMSYRPNPGTECCAGNVNRFMPNYVLNMFYRENDDIYLNLFGASRYEDEINGKKVIIEEETNFPFDEKIKLHIKTDTEFNLFIRKPGYASKIDLSCSLKALVQENEDYYQVKINSDLDIEYNFESEIKIVRVNKKGLMIKKGVLVYSYGMYGDRQIDNNEERSSKEFPAYNIYPDHEYGYALKYDEINPIYFPNLPKIFSLKDQHPYIEVSARKVLNYDLEKRIRLRRVRINYFDNSRTIKYEKGNFVFTPDILKKEIIYSPEVKRIRLYPYGACKIRETIFKEINE